MIDSQILSFVIFLVTYIGIVFTRLPWINVDRPSAAFAGAIAMISFGILSFEEAVQAIDFHTLALLLGMMIILASMQADGFFNYLTHASMHLIKNQKVLLIYVILFAGIGSAFMVNDVVVLMLTPLIISICRNSQIDPVPFLVAEILSANVGSAMTMTGNPQNMLIGINSGLSYIDFFLRLFPVSFLGLIVIYWLVLWLYKKNFTPLCPIRNLEESYNFNTSRLMISVSIFLLVCIALVVSKWLALPISIITLVGAAFTLITGHIKPRRIIDKVDWVLILFFASLFIVVRGIEKTGWIDYVIQKVIFHEDLQGIISLHLLSLFGSQIISNVPFTIVMLPMMKIAASDQLWIALASSSTLAGNATLIGAMANLLVVESAIKHGVKISFWRFLKPGLLCTFLTTLISIVVIWIEYQVF